jgi:hypothetical protein
VVVNENRHLEDVPNREDVAVERLLDLLPLLHPAWYQSLGLDPASHWALVRPLLKTPMLRQPEAEIDIIFGRMIMLAERDGKPKAVWPPSTDYLVAVEAKCQFVKSEDLESESNTVQPKTNLRRQLERNLDLGFQRVAALHIIAAQPSDGYWGVMRAASILGDQYLPIANGHASTSACIRSEKSVLSFLCSSLSVARTILSSLSRTAFCFHPAVLRFPLGCSGFNGSATCADCFG